MRASYLQSGFSSQFKSLKFCDRAKYVRDAVLWKNGLFLRKLVLNTLFSYFVY